MDLISSHQFVLVILCATVGYSLVNICSGEKSTAYFVFGDSLVDSGNNNYITTIARANYKPNGIDLPPYHQPTGRFTNGRTVPDIIGQELGLKSFTPPYLAPTTTGDVLLNGVNYASGGAGILDDTGEIFVGRISLSEQINNYAKTRQAIMSSIGSPAAIHLLQKAVFSVTMGSNDFLNNYMLSVTLGTKRPLVSPEVFIGSMISNYGCQLKRLYNMDARRIVIVNVGPIGCIPLQREFSPLGGRQCTAFPNQLAMSFNRKLKSLVVDLNKALKGAVFVYADVYGIMLDIFENYHKYGLEVADSACCHVAGRFGGWIPCSPASTVCPDRSKYIFWDTFHPSDSANAIIARRLLDGGPNEIFPMNIIQLIHL